jgi:hypothetical protein
MSTCNGVRRYWKCLFEITSKWENEVSKNQSSFEVLGEQKYETGRGLERRLKVVAVK